jgi:hypothetical protein
MHGFIDDLVYRRVCYVLCLLFLSSSSHECTTAHLSSLPPCRPTVHLQKCSVTWVRSYGTPEVRASKDERAYFAERQDGDEHPENAQERKAVESGMSVKEGCLRTEQMVIKAKIEEISAQEDVHGTTASIPVARKQMEREGDGSSTMGTEPWRDSLQISHLDGVEVAVIKRPEMDGEKAFMPEKVREGVSAYDKVQAGERGPKGILTSRSTESISSVKSRLHTSPSGPVLFSDRKKVGAPAGEAGDGGWGQGDSRASVPRKLRSTVIASRPLAPDSDPYETDSQQTRHVPTYRKPTSATGGGLVRPTTARFTGGRKRGQRSGGREGAWQENTALENLGDDYEIRKEAFESEFFRVVPVDVMEF